MLRDGQLLSIDVGSREFFNLQKTQESRSKYLSGIKILCQVDSTVQHVFQKYRNWLTKHENDYNIDKSKIIYLFPFEVRIAFNNY